MNTNELRAGASEPGIIDRSSDATVERRSAPLILVGVSAAIGGAVLTVASSPDQVLMAFGLGIFLAGSVVGLTSASLITQPADQRTRDERAGGTDASRLFGSIPSMHLGPDREQVVGRQTGART